MFKSSALVVTALLASSVAVAQDWYPITTNIATGTHFQVKAHSVNVSKNDKGLTVVTATIRMVKGTNFDFAIVAFPFSYCSEGLGELIMADTSGNVVARNNIAQAGGNVGSQLADAMCVAIKTATAKPSNDTTL